MRASRNDVARVVERVNLTLLIPSDGSRRHFLLRQLQQKNRSSETIEYLSAQGAQLMGLFRLLFSCGVKNILCPILQSPNFERGADYVRNAAQATASVVTGDAFSRFYRDWKVETHLYGGWDVIPYGDAARDILTNLNSKLGAINSGVGERKVLYGFCPGSFVDEMCARSALFAAKNGACANSSQIRKACFPHGPDKLDVVINTDLIRTGYLVPPTLDWGAHYYHLAYMSYDLSENNLRQILYDYLFLRNPEPEEGQTYGENELRDIQTYLTRNKDRIIGLGKRVGGGYWLPDWRWAQQDSNL